MHDWKKLMNENYPDDLYDGEDFSVTKKLSVLRKEMYSHITIGFGFGVMATVALAGAVAWYMGP